MFKECNFCHTKISITATKLKLVDGYMCPKCMLKYNLAHINTAGKVKKNNNLNNQARGLTVKEFSAQYSQSSTKSIKEIIYLDTDLLYSTYSQVESGVPETRQISNQNSTQKRISSKGGLNAGADIGIEDANSVIQSRNELINISYNDYLLTKLMDEMDNIDIKDSSSIGDLGLLKEPASFQFFNFETIANLNSSDLEILTEVLFKKAKKTSEEADKEAQAKLPKKTSKLSKKTRELLQQSQEFQKRFSSYTKPLSEEISSLMLSKDKIIKANAGHLFNINRMMKEIMPDTILLKTAKNDINDTNEHSIQSEKSKLETLPTSDDSISFLQKKFLKISSSQLFELYKTERKINILGIIENRLPSFLRGFDHFVNSSKLDSRLINDMGLLHTWTPALINQFLISNNFASSGFRVIRPIAIYFETNKTN